MHFVKWFWGLTRPGLSLSHYRATPNWRWWFWWHCWQCWQWCWLSSSSLCQTGLSLPHYKTSATRLPLQGRRKARSHRTFEKRSNLIAIFWRKNTKLVVDGFSQYPMLVSRKGQKNLTEVRTASILKENSSNTLQHLGYYVESALRRSAANIFPKISTVHGVTEVYILSNFMEEWYVLFAI